MTDINLFWAGAADAASGSTYRIRRTLDMSAWTELAAAQAATSPYTPDTTALDGDHAYGVTEVALLDATDFAASGHAFLEGEGHISWTGKSGNNLTGVTWLAGYGTWLDGTVVIEAHETYNDSGVSIVNGAVVYEIVHTNPDGEVSPPTFVWYYYPATPPSDRHCQVIVSVFEDLAYAVRDGVSVVVELSNDSAFADDGGQLDAGTAATRTQTTNDLGLAVFSCWRTSAKVSSGDMPTYTFRIDGTEFSVQTIPDLNWVLLSDLLV